MALRANIAANFVGQAVTALLALACVPFYVKALGSEAYGLIGLYSTLYAVLGFVDGSVQAMLSRAAARALHGSEREDFCDRLRTLEWLYAFATAAFALVAAVGGGLAARHWLKTEALDADLLRGVFVWMALALATRFYEGLYKAALLGFERQVMFNTLFVVGQSLRWIGAVVVVTWVKADIGAFFQWQLAAGAVSALMLGAATRRAANWVDRPRWRPALLWGERRFLGGVLATTAAAVLLTQTDKLLLSHLLPLSEYGAYMLAVSAGGALMLLISPVADGFYPRLARHHAAGDFSSLATDFHLGAQLVSVLAGSATATGVIFAPWLLQWWLADTELVERVTPVFRILLVGNLLNALMWMPYRAQLAYGGTGLAARINAVAVLLLVPLIILLASRWGAEGAAWAWVALNAGYVFLGARLVFRKILHGQEAAWYLRDLGSPIGALSAFSALVAWVAPVDIGDDSHMVFPFVFGLSAAAMGSLFAPAVGHFLGGSAWQKNTG